MFQKKNFTDQCQGDGKSPSLSVNTPIQKKKLQMFSQKRKLGSCLEHIKFGRQM
jgi:hypothetical protein